jgi:hypothetical protein
MRNRKQQQTKQGQRESVITVKGIMELMHAQHYQPRQNERRICAWCGCEDLPFIGEIHDGKWTRFYCSYECLRAAWEASSE